MIGNNSFNSIITIELTNLLFVDYDHQLNISNFTN